MNLSIYLSIVFDGIYYYLSIWKLYKKMIQNTTNILLKNSNNITIYSSLLMLYRLMYIRNNSTRNSTKYQHKILIIRSILRRNQVFAHSYNRDLLLCHTTYRDIFLPDNSILPQQSTKQHKSNLWQLTSDTFLIQYFWCFKLLKEYCI